MAGHPSPHQVSGSQERRSPHRPRPPPWHQHAARQHPCRAVQLRRALRPTDVDHGMRCPSHAAHITLRHDILEGILRRVVHRADMASTQEPALSRLPGLAGGAGISASGASIRVEAQGDILLALPGGITIADIPVIHRLSINTLPAGATTAGAAARRDQQKQATYVRVERNGFPFVPFFVESYGRLSQPAMKLLHVLGDRAASPGEVNRASFLAGSLRELSISLCRGNFFMYRACLGMLTKSSGTGFRAGMCVPKDGHGLQ
jgi:hypothetical protein